MTDEELIKQYREQQAALNGGCIDGHCVIEKTTGMHTNGGCGCLQDLDFSGRHRVGVMLRAAQVMADRIEEFGKELKDKSENALMWQNAYVEENNKLFLEWVKRDKAEAKLEKAMAVLQEIKDYDGHDLGQAAYIIAFNTLAELEKTE